MSSNKREIYKQLGESNANEVSNGCGATGWNPCLLYILFMTILVAVMMSRSKPKDAFRSGLGLSKDLRENNHHLGCHSESLTPTALFHSPYVCSLYAATCSFQSSKKDFLYS